MCGTEVSPESISEVTDEVMALVDGFKGVAESIEVAFPSTTVHTGIVHLIRNSLDHATWKDRKAVAAARRPVGRQPSCGGSRFET